MKKIIILCSLMMIVSISLTACTERKQKIDWNLCGEWFSADGSCLGDVELAFETAIPHNYKDLQSVELSIRIDWPSGFAFPDCTNDVGGVITGVPWGSKNIYIVAPCNWRNMDTLEMFYYTITFHPEKGLFGCKFHDGSYIIASLNPNADTSELKKYIS